MEDSTATGHLDLAAQLKVVGVGGGGGNTVHHMLSSNALEGVDYISTNTDRQALESAPQGIALPIGNGMTRGLGAGANPDIGRQAALESQEDLKTRLSGADMVFITAGMGGGTGTGAAPVIASIAREMGMLTVAVVTRPFGFEGGRRKAAAEEGIKALADVTDSLIVIPNDRLIPTLGKSASLLSAFAAVNDVLKDGVAGIAEMITAPGMINVDFADVRTVMSNQGRAKIGVGSATGESRARDAAEAAINSPLLEELDLQGAKGVLINITSGPDLSLGEFNEVGEIVRSFASEEAVVVIGTSLDMALENEVRVTVVAAGLDPQHAGPPKPEAQQPAPRTREPESPASSKAPADDDYLDIPTFLRRQVR